MSRWDGVTGRQDEDLGWEVNEYLKEAHLSGKGVLRKVCRLNRQ